MHSAWLYDLLSRRVAKLVVCNPHKNALLKSGSKRDAIDARKLAELLRAGLLSAVYHGASSALEVQHLARRQITAEITIGRKRLIPLSPAVDSQNFCAGTSTREYSLPALRKGERSAGPLA
jgi:hypothetical protein